MNAEQLTAALDAAGFDVVRALPRALFDAHVPEPWRAARVSESCESIWLIGHSGPHFWSRFERSPEAELASDPVDSFARRSLREITDRMTPRAELALYLDRREGEYLPLLTLARCTGLGAASRLGLLLHPRLGPWWSVRAAMFTPLETEPLTGERISPCLACSAPCAQACHGNAVFAGGFAIDACLSTRASNAACFDRCDARLACPMGREHKFGARALRHHSRLVWTEALRTRASQAVRGAGNSPPKIS